MPSHDIHEILDEMHGYIRRDIAAGFQDRDEIVASVVEILSDEADTAVLHIHASRMTAEVLADQLAEQQFWPAVTDCDRLDAAFLALEDAGIVCRQNFTCCGTCGVAEIWDEIEATREAGANVGGYAFYHMQDTWHAVEGDGMYLSYGAVVEGEAAALAVGHEVVAALERHGLRTDWNGQWTRRIGITLDWKRRRAA